MDLNKVKGKQMKTMNRMLIVAGTIVLLAGCASEQRESTGAMGNDAEVSQGSGHTLPRMPAQSGPNGIISPSNPYGLGGANTTASPGQ